MKYFLFCHLAAFGVCLNSLSGQSFSVSIQVNQSISCHGMNDGVLTAVVNPPGNTYTYLWSNGATTTSLENVPAGAYAVSVQNVAGEQHQGTTVLNEPTVLMMESMTSLPLAVDSVGSVEVQTTGGTAPYSYQWIDALGNVFSNTQNLIDAPVGSYEGMAIDANGCMAEISPVVLTQTSKIVDPSRVGIRMFPNPASGFVTIRLPQGETAQLQLLATNGQLIAQETINSGDNTININNLPAGIYIAVLNGTFGISASRLTVE